MKDIIITITDMKKRAFYDVEVPTDMEFGKLREDIVNSLNGYDPELMLNPARTEFLCYRTGRQVMAGETLATAGVWNGDYLTAVEV